MTDVDVWAVLVASALSLVALGGLWYSPLLFLKPWLAAAGIAEADKQKSHPARVFGVSFVFTLISAWLFAAWLGPDPAVGDAVVRGALTGACFVAACFGINYQFAGRKTVLWLVDGGYHTAQFALFGLVFGLWP